MTAPFDPARLRMLDDRLAQWVAEGRYAGLEWAVGDASGPLHTGRAGARSAAEPDKGLPERPFYRIYSMTKPIVSLVAMQLVEECRLALHAPVGEFLPEYAEMQVFRPDGMTEPARSPITVQQLLSHTAGLSYGFLADRSAALYAQAEAKAAKGLPLREHVKTFADIPLAFHPGEGWKYSIATDLLGAVVEIAGGAPLPVLARERVTGPLGLSETGFTVPEGAADRVMAIYGGKPGGLNELDLSKAYPHSNPDWARGGHGMFSTLADYGTFSAALLRLAQGARVEGLVAPATLAMMTADLAPETAHPLGIQLPVGSHGPGLGGYGFGLGFRTCLPAQGAPKLRKVPALEGEFGWSGAAETWFSVAPKQGVWGVFMSQNLDWPGASTDFQVMMASAIR
ncbi:serine hydrolase domain-containing protein [Rhodovulum sp. DZ06]|uniref:serine hydrolase domain-containing protein n=1 Tax=Rhodovulum sp. DZ06 TaxID=3425126 RepID=UPI003D358596